jgi:hypothetical protein
LSAEYSQGSVASCRNGRSFTRGAFTLKKYFSPFLPFGPLVQLRWCLPLSEEDDDDDDDDDGGGARRFRLPATDGGGGGGGTCSNGVSGEGEGGSLGRFGGICDAHLENLSSLPVSLSSSVAVFLVALNRSACSINFFSISSSAFCVNSFIHCSKISFSF